MAYPTIPFLERIPEPLSGVLKRFVTGLTGFVKAEHGDNGQHTAITAQSIAVTGNGSFGGDVSVGDDVTVGDDLTVTGQIILTRLVSTFGNVIGYDGANQVVLGIPGTTATQRFVMVDSAGNAAAAITATGVGAFNANVQATFLVITDGVTAPAATAGQAKIYVDTADGDLKIVFGDGTVKTIVTD